MKDLLLEDNPLLRQESEKVTLPLSEEDLETLQGMAAFIMQSQTKELDDNGDKFRPAVGLSAVQVGIPKRMFVIALPNDSNELIVMAIVNPIIEKESNSFISLSDGEECMSVQSMESGIVARKEWIRWSGKLVDLETGKLEDKKLTKLSGYLGIIFQHEYDHLIGLLFTDVINIQNNSLQSFRDPSSSTLDAPGLMNNATDTGDVSGNV
jgi:peptide deformylase